MNEGSNGSPRLSRTASIEQRNRREKSNGKGKVKEEIVDTDAADSESLAAIQRKVSEFQPKINSLLPRMLNKGTATSKSTPVEQSAGKSKPTAAAVATTSSTKVLSPRNTTKATTPTSKSKSPKTAATSVASLIPKGSRAKPLPSKASELPAPPAQTRPTRLSRSSQVGDRREQAIVLSSSLPSSSSQGHGLDTMWDIAGDEQESEMDVEQQHTSTATTTPSKAGVGAGAATVGVATAVKVPSVISIGSIQSDYIASVIPSVRTGWITSWMGGVKEAMEGNGDGQGGSAGLVTSADSVPLGATPAPAAITVDNKPANVVVEPRRPGLRPSPAISRHSVIPVALSSTPSPPAVVRSSLSESEHYHISERADETQGNGKCVAKDSMPSTLSPAPLFYEASDLSEKNGANAAAASTAKMTAAAAMPTGARSMEEPYRGDDDLSTVVGHQPTQDSFVGISSLLSFRCDKGEGEDPKEEEHSKELRQKSKEPPLPSALTSSCLEELGLLKRRTSGGQDGPRKRSSGVGLSPAYEDVVEEDDCDRLILAQEEVFPASIGAAPASAPLSPSSSIVPKPPRYTFALPDRVRQEDRELIESQNPQQELNVDEGSPSFQPGQRQGYNDPSFPSPPSHTSFSTLPTMPTFPTIPSFSSLVQNGILEEEREDGQLGQSQEQTQEQRWSQAQDHSQEHERDRAGLYRDPSFPSLTSQISLEILPTLPTFPSVGTLGNSDDPSLIIIDSQDGSQEEN
ncbi:hypothetical protein BGZ58_000786 [Dissophora ornata]|nr:hypothetical protein BGZ58_000786 [Dissophora ornata]